MLRQPDAICQLRKGLIAPKCSGMQRLVYWTPNGSNPDRSNPDRSSPDGLSTDELTFRMINYAFSHGFIQI